MKFASCVVFAICLGAAAAEVYFEEDFSGDWESRWVVSENKDDLGKFVVTAGINGDSSNVGLKTSQDAKFYGISAATKEFSNKDKPLVVQYSVKHEQGIDCGGAYLKLGGSPFDGKKFHEETPYNVMFGPDICGMTKRTHLIFNYKEKNLLKDKDMRTESDELTHVYTLVVKPDNTFAVSIDGSEVESGKLADGWKFLEPKEIDDPEDKKPSTGLMRLRWMILRTRSLRAMMTSLPRLLTPRPPSQMTGMTSPTASGRLLRSTTLSTRVSGRPRESRTPHTRECGHPRRSPTLRTLTTPALDSMAPSHGWVSMCGK